MKAAMTEANNVLLKCSQLRKTYRSGEGDLEVLHGLDLELQRSEFIAITGESGSGKSTLLHLLGCLDDPSEGTIELDGKPLRGVSETEKNRIRTQRFGFVFQFHHLLSEFTAQENVALPGLIAGLSRPEALSRAEALLQDLRMSERKHHRPSKLSGGEQQRVAVARAMINEPDLLLMDEPTGNLDANNSKELIELVKEQQGKRELAVILVTHDPVIAAYADRQLTLADGRLADT